MSGYIIQSGNKFNPWATNLIQEIRRTDPESRFWIPFSGTRLGFLEAKQNMGSIPAVEIEWDTESVHNVFNHGDPSKVTETWASLEALLKPGAMQRIIMADRYYGHPFVKSVHPEVSPEVENEFGKIDTTRAFLCHLVSWVLTNIRAQKPKSVFCYCVAGSLSMALWEVCDALGIPFMCLDFSRIDGFHYVARSPFGEFEGAQAVYPEIEPTTGERRFAETHIQNFRGELQNNQTWHLFAERLAGFTFSKALRSLVGNILRFRNWDPGVPYLGSPLHRIGQDFLCKIRGRAHIRSCEIQSLSDLPPSFIYVPLHTDPEASTMVRAPFVQNQAFVIENIVRALGLSHAVVVKEHLLSLGWREESFYRDLRKFPNVVFASPHLEGPKILAKAAAVATITGTSGWQGVLVGRPVLTYSRPYYHALGEGFLHVTGWNELEKEWPAYLRDFKPVADEKIVRMIAAIVRTSLPLASQELWAMQSPEHCARVCPEQIKILGQHMMRIGGQEKPFRAQQKSQEL